MTFDYAEVADTAADILAEFGAAATLTRTDATGEYDPAEGEQATTVTTQACTAALFPYGDKYVDGTNILSSDRQAFIAVRGLTLTPQAGDVLTWGDETLTVVKVKALAPARVNCLYEAQVRA